MPERRHEEKQQLEEQFFGSAYAEQEWDDD